jgi:hypothetical protein
MSSSPESVDKKAEAAAAEAPRPASSAKQAPPPPPPFKPARTSRNADKAKTDSTKRSSASASPGSAPAVGSVPTELESGTLKPANAVAEAVQPAEARPPSAKPPKVSDVIIGKYSGKQPLQFALWAHYMTYGSSVLSVLLGIFAIAWTKPYFFNCKVDDKYIFADYIKDPASGICNATYTGSNGELAYACCDDTFEPTLRGNAPLGILYILYGIGWLIAENETWGVGLWYPTDIPTYKWRISIFGIVHMIVGIAGCFAYSTVLAGVFWISTGIVSSIASWRKEAGDGGREARAAAAASAAAAPDRPRSVAEGEEDAAGDSIWRKLNPFACLVRARNEDKLVVYTWIGLYICANVILYIVTLHKWIQQVDGLKQGLLEGTLNIDCDTPRCSLDRNAIRYGPLSDFAPWAKGFGNLLNFNCALIIVPVTKLVLQKVNNIAESTSLSGSIFAKLVGAPLTKFLPVHKNLEFHKIISGVVFVSTIGHIFFHLMNLLYSNNVTMERFKDWGWKGTDLFTGAIATLAMFFMYSAAPDVVRRAKYEIFFWNHMWLFVFLIALLLHGPVFFIWALPPFTLYLIEKYLERKRGNEPFLITRVEWIEPVLALYFRPKHKDAFEFKEGQYLMINCPAISKNEWHPFTISSAVDDLNNTSRIELATGADVVPVPRPKNLPASAKWDKYCRASIDPRAVHPDDLLDKHETVYNDYISLHIKVHGLTDIVARSWTRKFKEYLQSLNPQAPFPFYFTRRDARGDIRCGKLIGPEGLPIIRIDGPYSAPAEHYMSYRSTMVVGAGIGLTPCTSILTALTKYRWKKNYTPEILHLYWVVRQSELDAFQWFVHMLTELQYELKKGREAGQIAQRYYCEINVYVTGVAKQPKAVPPLKRPSSLAIGAILPSFSADELYAGMMNPSVSSKDQVQQSKNKTATNRYQDVFVWNGRPMWDDIFQEVKANRQHASIGVFFCGTPAIGKDLSHMCKKYSNAKEDCIFSLHKENF